MERVGTVAQLWRFPVKSMRGERVAVVRVTERGVEGDRAWAVALAKHETLLSAKRDGVLLRCRAWTDTSGVSIELPDGRIVRPPDGADALAELLERDVDFARAEPDAHARYDLPQNYATTGKGVSMRFPCPPGTFFDLGHLHLVTTSTLAAFGNPDVRRLRPNVLIACEDDGFVEDAWVGRELVVGEARLQVSMRTPRCVMTTREQGPDLPRAREVLTAIAKGNENNAGIYGSVVAGGAVREGDTVSLA